ncbi:hypothetical protein ACFONE_08580 [Xanthomonas dyei]|uniref:hypothetical protein n=1 Tax=Xanthomonas dyei TaxID=743699 RepID=UPI0036093CB6
MSQSSYSYKAKARDCSAVRMRMREIALSRVHYGCERVFVMLRREGWRDNHKAHPSHLQGGRPVFEALSASPQCRSARRRQPIKVATAPNTLWGMDFVSDALFDGRRFRLLRYWITSRMSAWPSSIDQSLRDDDVAEGSDTLAAQRGKPEATKVDNGSELPAR